MHVLRQPYVQSQLLRPQEVDYGAVGGGQGLLQQEVSGYEVSGLFKAYTNTYAKVELLRQMYEEALQVEDVVGIVIGTRPDCVSDELLDYLEALNLRHLRAGGVWH